ncbi:Pseudouridylate synthase 7 homolog [Strongyloides ratti]|uniref:Pseudouridylate synthase 7 homolog n=1 Tax=Strongyloides ratti TaxID=34506 RepID=A0A090MZS8_STRRB|nr:Pseudouridylate synthase 7 homolog [Strongyloides ratti]CEF69459.1 Pseudouridylate synthase 7 homolog [Strongyloides ratti]
MGLEIRPEENGIRCYANPEVWPPIVCQFKLLFSDFIVEELSSDGVVSLWPLDGDNEPEQETPINAECKEVSEVDMSNIPNGLTNEDVDSILKIVNGETVSINIDGLEKSERTAIHNFIKSLPNKNLSSTTKDNTIVVSLSKQNERKRFHWPDDTPNYCHFTLSKENKDTSYAIREIATRCGLNVKLFSFSGNKDRRGVTSQKVAAYRVKMEKLKKCSKSLKNIRLHNFEYKDNVLGLGDNFGNRFQVILRDVGKNLTLDDIKKRCEGINKYGFLNYFGHQRFGTLGINTAEVGRLILKKNYQEAINQILSSKKDMSRETFQEALFSYATDKDAKKAFNMIKGNGKKHSLEGNLLKALIDKDGNCHNALFSMPRETISLYIHAFQSFIFNEVISQRIEEFGPVILEGDIDENGKVLGNDSTIFDISIPLVSNDMDIPNNKTKDIIESMLKKYEVSCDDFKSLTKHVMISKISRKMFKKLDDPILCDLIKYSDEKNILQRELINGPDIVNEDNFRAIKLVFSLEAGDYATMLLREILRFNVDKQSQKNMNKIN